MRKTTFMILGALTVICAASVATAEPAGIILVRDGCGLGSHRGPLGYCRPNGFPVRRLGGVLGGNCPPSYHLGPFGNRLPVGLLAASSKDGSRRHRICKVVHGSTCRSLRRTPAEFAVVNMRDGLASSFLTIDRLRAASNLSVLGAGSILCIAIAARINGPTAATMAAIFVTSIMSSIVGFSFAPVGGAAVSVLTKNPVDVVNVLTMCGLANQALMTWQMRHEVSWRTLRIFLAGGLLGLPLGLAMWTHAGCRIKENNLALVFISLGVLMPLLRRIVPPLPHTGLDFVAGIVGGVTGGAMEFPGAPVAIRCNLKERGKLDQRAVFQPFMLIVLLIVIALMNAGFCNDADKIRLVPAGFLCIPAGLLGTSIGMMLFRRMSDKQFSIALSLQLIMSGLGYMLI